MVLDRIPSSTHGLSCVAAHEQRSAGLRKFRDARRGSDVSPPTPPFMNRRVPRDAAGDAADCDVHFFNRAWKSSSVFSLAAVSSHAGHASFRGRRLVSAATSICRMGSGCLALERAWTRSRHLRLCPGSVVRTGQTATRAVLRFKWSLCQVRACFSPLQYMVPSVHIV
jgi:hypothetical protein